MTLEQSKLESGIETVVNISSGFILSLLVWTYAVAPLYGFEVDQKVNFQITLIFTVSSIIRSYLWRRFFTRNFHKKLHLWLTRSVNRV